MCISFILDDDPDCHGNNTVCTCDGNMCNTFNSSTSWSPASSTTTQVNTLF